MEKKIKQLLRYLQIESLVERVKGGEVKEVILALSSTMELSLIHISHAVDMNGESAQIAHLDALSCQKLLPHTVHRLDQDRLDVGLSLIHILIQ